MASRSKVVLALAFLFTLTFNISNPSKADEVKKVDEVKKDAGVNKETDKKQDTNQEKRLGQKIKYKCDTVNYDKGTGKATLVGNVEVVIEDETTVTGEEIDVDLNEKIVSSDKNFTIVSKKDNRVTTIDGKSFVFDIETKRITTKYSNLQTSAQAPDQKVYIFGDEITVYNQGERISIVNGSFTTCNFIEENSKPHYAVSASMIDFTPNDKVIAWNSIVKVGGNSIFWFPFWYLPLNMPKNPINLDIGKNEVEGIYMNFKHYYNLNDYHDGTLYWRIMEKKWLTLGFEHTWIAKPNSVSYLFAYGNPFNSRYFLETDSKLKSNITPLFEDKEIYFRHEQWLWFLPNAQFNFTTHVKNFYNLSSVLSSRDDYDENSFEFKDSEIYQPSQGSQITFTPNFTSKYKRQRDTSLDSTTAKLKTSASNNDLSLNGKIDLKVNNFDLDFSSDFRNTIRQQLYNPTASTTDTPVTATPTVTATDTTTQTTRVATETVKDSFFKSSDNIDFRNNLTINYPIMDTLTFTGNFNYINTDQRTFKQADKVSLAPIQTSNDSANQQINSNMSLTQKLDWGSLSLKVENRFDFLDSDLFPKDANGIPIIDDTKLTTEQKKKKDEATLKRKSGNYINKMPELELQLNPFFNDVLPVNLSTNVGRYFESTTFSTTNYASRIQELVRSEVKLGIGSKDIDLGLGNKVNFGGTEYVQRVYQTQDAQYSLTGQVNYANNFFDWLTPNVSYTKVITDPKNNTPFSFDRLSRNKQDLLTSSLKIGSASAFNFNLTNIGYDYQNKNYLTPVGISLKSDFEAGLRYSLTAQTGFRLNNITEQDIKKINPDYQSKDQFQKDIDDTTINDYQFQKKYLDYSRTEAKTDIASLDETKLKEKYGIDNRLYDVDKKDVVSTKRLTESDVGKFEFRGTRLAPINITFGVGTPWEFGGDSSFGKDIEIPWGVAASIGTNFNLYQENFYKTIDDKGNPLTVTKDQNFKNLFNKFQNTTLAGYFVIGGNWSTHTEIQLNLTLIPPEMNALDIQARQTNRPSLPFNTILSIKKDLHDFILSLNFQDEYVPSNNKRDFMFSVNLEMVAFPFSTKDITGATKNLSSLTSGLK